MTMTRRKLQKLRSDVQQVLNSPAGRSFTDIEALALRLGRERVNRGGHLTYERTEEPKLPFPLSIVCHGGKDINKHTAKGMAKQLMSDVELWEEHLDELGIPEDE